MLTLEEFNQILEVILNRESADDVVLENVTKLKGFFDASTLALTEATSKYDALYKEKVDQLLGVPTEGAEPGETEDPVTPGESEELEEVTLDELLIDIDGPQSDLERKEEDE